MQPKNKKKEFVIHADSKRKGHSMPQRGHMGSIRVSQEEEGGRGKHRQAHLLWFPWEELVREQAGSLCYTINIKKVR